MLSYSNKITLLPDISSVTVCIYTKLSCKKIPTVTRHKIKVQTLIVK